MYDLIIRDATIVSSAGRQVADVAVKDGRIAYVGPRPPRSGREEISAIGRFLMPGVIDTAVQFDVEHRLIPDASGREFTSTWEQESAAAVSGGVTTVIALPHGTEPVVDESTAHARHDRARRGSWCDYGLWAAARAENHAELHRALQSGLISGVLARVGKGEEGELDLESLSSWRDTPGLLGVQLPASSRVDARAVLGAVGAQERPVHLVHLSTSSELDLIDPVRGDMPITAGVTPHHLFLSSDDADAKTVRTLPPLRPEHDRRTLWHAIKRGRLECVASDHHASTAADPQGVPGSELLLPLMMSAVKHGRLSLELLVSMCSEAPARIFGLSHKGRVAKGADADLVLFREPEVGRVQSDSLLSGADWSPYLAREASPKPDMVFVGGALVATRGELVARNPTGRHVTDERPHHAA